MQVRHYSRRTETAHVAWIRRYIFFHGKRHPAEMGAPEITRFLTSLAVDGKVAASMQNQALSALLFLYREVLQQDVPWLDNLAYAERPHRRSVVLTREEVRAVLVEIHGVLRLMAVLLYGAGLRLLEYARLRVKDLDMACNQIVVRAGKENKDRLTTLPGAINADLMRHLDLARRQHLHQAVLQRAVKTASLRAGVAKPVSGHTFRHSFAPHSLEDNHDIRTVQELLGHRDVSTAQVYAHVLNRGQRGAEPRRPAVQCLRPSALHRAAG